MPRPPPRKFSVLLLLTVFLGAALSQAREAPRSPAQPPRPELLDSSRAPRAARILGQVRLSYDPGLAPAERDRDFLGKVAWAKSLLEVGRLVDLRHQAMNAFNSRGRSLPGNSSGASACPTGTG